MIAGLVFLVYYGIRVAWWAPIALFGLGIVFDGFVYTRIERAVGLFPVSMMAFIGWPVCTFLMFTSASALHARGHEKQIIEEFQGTMMCTRLAIAFIDADTGSATKGGYYGETTVQLYREALVHAEKVDPKILNSRHAGWGDHFEKEFLAGLRLVVEGYANVDRKPSLAGQKLILAWSEWFRQNSQVIDTPQ